jgi:hypothetical protein
MTEQPLTDLEKDRVEMAWKTELRLMQFYFNLD